MGGRLRGHKAEAELARTVALIGAYYSGQLAQADWNKMPDLKRFLAQFEPARPLTNDELAARFSAWAEQSAAQTPEENP